MRTRGLRAPIALALLLSLTAAATARGQLGAPDVVDGAPIYTVLPVMPSRPLTTRSTSRPRRRPPSSSRTSR